uniref:replication initiation protein RepM n=1 Tax=Acinetobacter sp. YH16040 TaxID=2601185 RepID=UPI0015D173E7
FHCRWVDKIGYEPQTGIVFLRFTQDIVPLITRLEENFTKYELEQVSRLTSSYAIRLYELLIQWKAIGKTPVFELATFREQLGIGVNEYKRMDHFKTRVLDLAISEISEKTDIEATYQQHKKGRSISGFSFSFKQKKSKTKSLENQTISGNLDLFSKKMTDSQRHLFSNKLSELPEMSKYSQGTESYPQFAVRIAEMLKDSEKLKEFAPMLEKVGYR